MKKYLICNYGCDDGTEFEIELTEEQAKFLVKVFEENNKIAEYQCKPDLYNDDLDDLYILLKILQGKSD